jgi:hypothetical protein
VPPESGYHDRQNSKENTASMPKLPTNYSRYVVFSVLVIGGLLMIVWKQSLGSQNWAYPYLDQLAVTLLVSGVLGVLHSAYVDRENDSRFRKLFRIHDTIEEAALTEILLDHGAYNYTKMIEESQYLGVVLNDGQRWVGNNAVKLTEFFSIKGKEMEFFVTDPDGLFVAPLAQKTDYTSQALQEKIHRSCARLIESFEISEKKASLKIYFLKNYPVQSIFLTDKILLLSTYQTSSGRTNPPHLVFEKEENKDCVYLFTEHDIKNLKSESKIHYDSASKQQKQSKDESFASVA